MIFLLEKDGEKYGAEAADASTKWTQALEEVKVRLMERNEGGRKGEEGR